MIDKAKVIKGLECCISDQYNGSCPPGCPYTGPDFGHIDNCELRLARDSLALLKDSVQIQPLSIYLGMYAPAPDKAPYDWEHNMHENVEAWETFLRDAEEHRCYKLPVRDDEND